MIDRRPAADAETKYALGVVVLHWLLAALILSLFALGWYMIDIPRKTPERALYFNLHKSLGVTAAVFIVIFLLRRFGAGAPPYPASMPAWEVKASGLGHWALYLLLVIVPISGYISSSFSKWGVHVFGLPLPHWGWEDAAMRDIFVAIHRTASFAFIALIALHVIAALKHWLIDRDRILHRMLP